MIMILSTYLTNPFKLKSSERSRACALPRSRYLVLGAIVENLFVEFGRFLWLKRWS
jgi:hypothetical protein